MGSTGVGSVDGRGDFGGLRDISGSQHHSLGMFDAEEHVSYFLMLIPIAAAVIAGVAAGARRPVMANKLTAVWNSGVANAVVFLVLGIILRVTSTVKASASYSDQASMGGSEHRSYAHGLEQPGAGRVRVRFAGPCGRGVAHDPASVPSAPDGGVCRPEGCKVCGGSPVWLRPGPRSSLAWPSSSASRHAPPLSPHSSRATCLSLMGPSHRVWSRCVALESLLAAIGAVVVRARCRVAGRRQGRRPAYASGRRLRRPPTSTNSRAGTPPAFLCDAEPPASARPAPDACRVEEPNRCSPRSVT